jgi:hypothetical protein
MTLAEYLGEAQKPVLVEHGLCGRSLGAHTAYRHIDLGEPLLDKTTATPIRASGRRPDPNVRRSNGIRGQQTTPGVSWDAYRDESGHEQSFQRVWCVCLPDGHKEKIRVEKIGSLPVTFPEWKWGRAIDLPVVTI